MVSIKSSGKLGKVIGLTDANNTYQVMVNGVSNSYKSDDLEKPNKPKKSKKSKSKK
jgi:hypothetical protein